MTEDGRSSNNDPRLTIKTLACYVHAGHPLEVFEPPVRGAKGVSRDVRRAIGFTVLNPAAFDAIRWRLMKDELGGPRPPRPR
jgi:hypothetical protein